MAMMTNVSPLFKLLFLFLNEYVRNVILWYYLFLLAPLPMKDARKASHPRCSSCCGLKLLRSIRIWQFPSLVLVPFLLFDCHQLLSDQKHGSFVRNFILLVINFTLVPPRLQDCITRALWAAWWRTFELAVANVVFCNVLYLV
jgi:hypothetical protein